MAQEPERPRGPETPRGQVEIIPPGEERRQERFDDVGSSSRIWISNGGTVKIVKLGPVTGTLLLLAVLAVLALSFFFLSGLLLVLIPVAALVGVGAYLSGLLGDPFRRLR